MKKGLPKEFEEDYNRFIRSLKLLDIYVSELSFSRARNVSPDDQIPVKVSLRKTKASYKTVGEGVYEISYTALFKVSCVEDRGDAEFFRLRVTYGLVYETKVELTDDIFEAFIDRNLPLNIVPFLRETIYNSMYRAGLPPLLLPLVKFE